MSPAVASYSFVNITIPNSFSVQANGINNAGLVTGYYLDLNFISHGFVWTPPQQPGNSGTLQTLDYPSATFGTFLTGLNNQGVAIGYYLDAAGNANAVTYSLTLAAWSVLPAIPLPGYFAVEPSGINDHGVAVGIAFANLPLGTLSWIWHPDSQSYSYVSVPGAAEASTNGDGINNEGRLVGLFQNWPDIGSSLGFLREDCESNETECDYDQINALPGPYRVTAPTSINNHGAIAGSFLDTTGNSNGFVRTYTGAFKTVDYPFTAGGQTAISGINDQGTLCGNALGSGSPTAQAFVAYPQ